MTNHQLLVRSEAIDLEARVEVSEIETLVIFDDRVQDIDILTQALLPGSISFTIDAQTDALESITSLLASTGAKYLAIVAHGEPGVVHLGKTPLDIQQLQLHSHQLEQWGVAEIALYSCEVAQGNIGRDLIYQLSELTGATVAGSAMKTGSAALSGSWDLAVTTGAVVAPALFDAAVLATYGSVLPAVGLVANINPVEGGLLGTFDITLDGPAPVGGTVVNFTTTGTTATLNLDYRFSPGTGITDVTPNSFTIAAGATKATLNVIALRDTVIDPNEVITINTTGGIGYTIGDFVPKTDFAAGANARSVTTGDFNGDGKLDLATVSGTSGNVSVLLGNGSGGFATKVDFAVGGNPYSVTTGDFNGDGKLDLATANGNSSGTVSVLLGNGSGGFATKVDFAVGTGPYSVTTGDFNGDGKLDLATANYDSNNVSYQFKLSRRRMG
jgi:hypothetical protein